MKINQDFTSRTLSPLLVISKSNVELQALRLTGVLKLLGSLRGWLFWTFWCAARTLTALPRSSSLKMSLPTHCNQAPSSAGRFHEQTAPFTVLAH